MSVAPLLEAAPAIPLHAFAAMAAFVLGLVQFAAPKGTLPHRTIGWIWVALMAVVAASSFWIHQIRLVGPFSPIHLLSIFTLVMLPLAVWRAHTHRVADHRRIMIMTFVGALVIAGLFTLMPGRIMHRVIFGA
ncbi:putative membrane protein [Bradyrhizobium japonicum]